MELSERLRTACGSLTPEGVLVAIHECEEKGQQHRFFSWLSEQYEFPVPAFILAATARAFITMLSANGLVTRTLRRFPSAYSYTLTPQGRTAAQDLLKSQREHIEEAQ